MRNGNEEEWGSSMLKDKGKSNRDRWQKNQGRGTAMNKGKDKGEHEKWRKRKGEGEKRLGKRQGE